MAGKTKKLDLGNFKFKFTGILPPPPPPPPPSPDAELVVAQLEATLQSDRPTRIISLSVTSKSIAPRYRRRAGSDQAGATVDMTLHGAHATAGHVLAMLKDNDSRTRLRRIVDSERGVTTYEPEWEAKQLAAYIFLATK
ncbi:hypothetical protein ACC786_14350 [Rhizobium ruizarguesonis]